jgi:hypothetical protein
MMMMTMAWCSYLHEEEEVKEEEELMK